MTDVDTAFAREILNLAQRQREPDVRHERKADDFGRGLEIAERGVLGDERTLPATRPAFKPSFADTATRGSDTIRILIPLKLCKKNGRPNIMPPSNNSPSEDQTQDPHILRAIRRVWGWRRRMEAGDFATIQERAEAVGPAERDVTASCASPIWHPRRANA